MHRHTCHGIFVGVGLSNAHFWAHQSVDLWIVCHHGLIHAIESELVALGTPEGAFVDAKLIAVNRSAVEQFAVAIGRHLMSATVGGGDKEVVVFGESEGTRGIAEVLMTDASLERKCPDDGFLLPVVGYNSLGKSNLGYGFCAFGESGADEVVNFAIASSVEDVIKGREIEQHLSVCAEFFAFRIENHAHIVDIGLH